MTLYAADAAAQVQTETDLESIVREQIEAYAKSIDQNDATNKASKALASHGISGGGKKLSVGKNHALTAVLFNSNLMIECLTKSCMTMMECEQQISKNIVYGRGLCNWLNTYYGYSCYTYDYNYITTVYTKPKEYTNSDYLASIPPIPYVENKNSYDSSLNMLAGTIHVDIDLECNQMKKDTMVYDVTIILKDRFDFHTSSNSGFQNLISGIGALLFREFEWESKVTFQLTVPNECEHSYKTKTTKPTCTAQGYTTYTCSLCGCSYKADYTEKLSHKYDSETDSDCNNCGAVRFIRGDMNGDGEKTTADAVYLLRHTIMETMYPVSQSADMNGDGTVNSADAVYLLRHIIMPKEYPLK